VGITWYIEIGRADVQGPVSWKLSYIPHWRPDRLEWVTGRFEAGTLPDKIEQATLSSRQACIGHLYGKRTTRSPSR